MPSMMRACWSAWSGAPIFYLFPRITLRYPRRVSVERCARAIPERHHGGTERARRTTGQPSDILMKMCRGLIDRLLLLAAFGITVQGMSQFLYLLLSPLCRMCTPYQIPTILAPLPLSSILRFSLVRSAAFTAPASPVSCVNNVRGVLVVRDADSTRRYAPVSTHLNEIPDIPTDILSIAFTPDASTGSGKRFDQHRSSRRRLRRRILFA